MNAKPYDSPDNLWPLLVTLTIRKLQRQAQRHQAECRDIQQELSLDDAESWQEIASSEPTSEHAAQLTQDIETLMDRLEPADREILTFRLQGEELEAIARQLNCSERTVRRSMQRIRTHLAEHFDLQQPDVDPSVETTPLSGADRFTPPEACGLPTRLNRLIMNCLTKEPSQRILSMETLKQAFLD